MGIDEQIKELAKREAIKYKEMLEKDGKKDIYSTTATQFDFEMGFYTAVRVLLGGIRNLEELLEYKVLWDKTYLDDIKLRVYESGITELMKRRLLHEIEDVVKLLERIPNAKTQNANANT